jgi:hypothetical protein
MAELKLEKTPPTETDVLKAQLEIAEATIISLKAEKAGLETRVKELETLLLENSTAQTVLSTAAMSIGEELDALAVASIVLPEGLSRQEELAIISLRESQIADLQAKQDKYKHYIRGDI